MISDPLSVLTELGKYFKIIQLSKKAIDRLSKDEPIDDIREMLRNKVSTCAFTTRYDNESPPPLYSVEAMLDRPDWLKSQIPQAEAYVKMVIEKIEKDVGPFYSKAQVMDFKEGEERTLGDVVWTPSMKEITVKLYTDTNLNVSIQVDWEHGYYRTAKDKQHFGPWKFFIN